MSRTYNNKNHNTQSKESRDNINIIMICNIEDDVIPLVKLTKRLNDELSYIELSYDQMNVLYYLDKGIALDEITRSLNISMSTIALWKLDNELFKACIDTHDTIRTSTMENKLLDSYDKNSDTLKTLAIRGKLPQYRDNYMPKLGGVSRIMIEFSDGSAINPDIGAIDGSETKDITDSSNEGK